MESLRPAPRRSGMRTRRGGRYGRLAFVVLDVTFNAFPRRGGVLRRAAAGIAGHIMKMLGTRLTVALYVQICGAGRPPSRDHTEHTAAAFSGFYGVGERDG